MTNWQYSNNNIITNNNNEEIDNKHFQNISKYLNNEKKDYKKIIHCTLKTNQAYQILNSTALLLA